MKIERSQVELVLADATAAPVSRWHVNDTFNRELVAELCRAWLALDAAPEVAWNYANKESKAALDIALDRAGYFMGQRVRLVATPASGGPRDG